MAAPAADPVPHRLRHAAAWPLEAGRWRFERYRRPRQPAWFPRQRPLKRAPPYAPIPDAECLRPRLDARPQSGAPALGIVLTDALALRDSTPERCSPAHPASSDTREPVPE